MSTRDQQSGQTVSRAPYAQGALRGSNYLSRLAENAKIAFFGVALSIPVLFILFICLLE